MLILLLFSSALGDISPSKKFYDNVVNNISLYDRNFAPYEFNGKKIDIHIYCYQIILTSVVENTQSVGFITEINITWHDSRLKFDQTEYKTWHLMMPPNAVWIPRIDMYNGQNNRDYKADTQADIVEIRSDGNVSQVGYTAVDGICRMDVSAFPFDEQYCPIGFTSATVPIDKIELTTHPDLVFTVGLPEWDVVGAVAFKLNYYQSGRNFSLAQVLVHLRRKPNFYVHLLIVPTFIITTICISAMLLPIQVELGERINLGIAGMLSLTFMLSIMLSELPKAPTLPLLGKWVIAEIAVCCAAMLVPMILNIVENKLAKFELRCINKMISLAFFFVINIANILTTVLIFAVRDKIEAPKEFKPL